ncbi:TPA: 4-demethylwyosine synthase TYW1 [Candidatus Micrarchaeota archaeon]|nr:4-demethylwyosine synthase TYW1 [Candidatus Micrarchaeota archaeon]
MGRQRKDLEKNKYYKSARGKNRSIPSPLLKLLIRQKYHIAGEHSAAKLCHWSGEALKGGEGCYKNKFYGISSHRCLQCTPVLLFCNHACVFCWRMMPERKLKFEDMPCKGFSWDEPEKIAKWLIEAQKEIVSGFGGNPKVKKELFGEAMEPMHVAISLTGEPTMYPHLEKLLDEFHRRGLTTFLVTNGTFPEQIEKWKTYPTQFYVSMVAPNEQVYRKAIRPASTGLWKKYLGMLRLMPAIGEKTRTVLRMTLTRGVNDSDLEDYANQVRVAQPHYVEVKSMVFVGGARLKERGLSSGSMFEMDEIDGIAEKLAGMTGYAVSERHVPSRVVLLRRDAEAEKKRMIKWQ